MAFQASPQGDEWLHPRAGAPTRDSFEMIPGVILVLVVPSVGEEVPDGKGARDFRMLTADARAQFELFGLEVVQIPAKGPERSTRQAAGFAGDLSGGNARGAV